MPEKHALQVAKYARLYRLLADRPEFLNADAGARLDAAWTQDAPGSLALLDRVLVGRMSELDRMCGYAVAKLRTQASAGVLDVLGVLDPARVAAMYYALPEPRRHLALRDAAWSYHVGRVDRRAVAEAAEFWDDMPSLMVPTGLPHEDQADYFRFIREAERARLGLSHVLARAESALVHGAKSSNHVRSTRNDEEAA